ncbi:uncharacterized protein J4E79_008128 [Alternaria viburni]|uniref:uncharacterized protein n=1 Tax=Alternaria viburni TaxID=566460 RepID=UPI0020C493DA|nr:uncharacterized protein J4E79_008128 [Alternaria viburni]KAI4655063.1 hypothetical protein J4E79_008128 [Alternaria viburni]
MEVLLDYAPENEKTQDKRLQKEANTQEFAAQYANTLLHREQAFSAYCSDDTDDGRRMDTWINVFPGTEAYPTAIEIRRLTHGLVERNVDEYGRYLGGERSTDGLTSKTMADYSKLLDFTKEHGSVIRESWSKLRVSERQQVLRDVDPDIPIVHRPDLAFAARHVEGLYASDLSRHRFFASDLVRMPYINLQDLTSRPEAMLLLLHYRTCQLPAAFAHAELLHAACYQTSEEEHFACLQGWATSFTGQDEHDYGKMIPYINLNEARARIEDGLAVHPGVAVTVLRTQLYLYRLLHRICKRILARSLGLQPPPRSLSSCIFFNLQAFDTSPRGMAMIAMAPFLGAQDLNIDRMRLLMSTKIDECADHLGSLREDPAYFAEQFESQRKHCLALIKDDMGRTAPPELDLPDSDSLVVQKLMVSAYEALMCWTSALVLADKVKDAKANLPTTEPGDEIPLAYREAIKDLWAFLHDMLDHRMIFFNAGIQAAPSLRAYQHAKYEVENGEALMRLRPKTEVYLEPQNPVHRFVAGSYRLTHHVNVPIEGYAHILEYFDHLANTHQEVRNVITPFIAYQLSEVSLMSACIHHLHLYAPWSRAILRDLDAGLKSGTISIPHPWKQLNKVEWGVKLTKAANPSDGKFYYPSDEPTSQATVTAMQAAEGKLRRFWSMFLTETKRRCNGRDIDSFVDHPIIKAPIYKTGDLPSESKSGNDSQQHMSHLYLPLNHTSHDPKTEITGTFPSSKIMQTTSKKQRKKAKRSGNVEPEPLAIVPVPIEEPILPKIAVNRRSWKTLDAMFRVSQEVPWSDFLHTMTDIGFASQKLLGSAWMFRNERNQKAQVHEPHPDSRLTPKQARRIGRRFGRNWKWSMESFEIRGVNGNG